MMTFKYKFKYLLIYLENEKITKDLSESNITVRLKIEENYLFINIEQYFGDYLQKHVDFEEIRKLVNELNIFLIEIKKICKENKLKIEMQSSIIGQSV